MNDRISNYRQLRLVINPGDGNLRTYWALHANTVVKGVTYAVAIDGGVVEAPMPGTTEEAIGLVLSCAAALASQSSLWGLDYPSRE